MKKPSHLYTESKPIFEKLYKIVEDSLKPGDEEILAVLANAYLDYKRAAQVLNDRGPVMAGETMVRKNPAFDIVKENVKIIESLSSHFGLTPKSRNEKMGGTKKKQDPFDIIKSA